MLLLLPLLLLLLWRSKSSSRLWLMHRRVVSQRQGNLFLQIPANFFVCREDDACGGATACPCTHEYSSGKGRLPALSLIEQLRSYGKGHEATSWDVLYSYTRRNELGLSYDCRCWCAYFD